MRASVFLGVAALALIVIVMLNTLSTEGPGSRGLEVGRTMPPFAAPLALSELEGDANIATKPNSGLEGSRPACEVRGEDILNVCELYERGPVALAFFATRSERCEDQVDVLDDLRDEGVEVAAVAVRGSRESVRRIVRERGWELPVGYDHDGAVANLYAVAVCPTITFAEAGGRVTGTSLSFMDRDELSAKLEELR